MSMNAEIKEAYLKRLRTGKKYIGALREGNRFCAWGLLCDVCDAREWRIEYGLWVYDRDVFAQTGLDYTDRELLIQLNDGIYGPPVAFKRIAEIVEAYF